MSDFAKWFFGLFKDVFAALWNFITDILIAVTDLFLTALLALLAALPLPSFISANGLQTLLNGVPSDVWFFVSHFKLSQCFAMFGAAVAFRLARKALTLFQW